MASGETSAKHANALNRGPSPPQRSGPLARCGVVAEAIEQRAALSLAPRGRAMAPPGRDRQARAVAQHTVHPLRRGDRVLARRDRGDVVTRVGATL